MRYLVISDIHANLEAYEAVMAAAKRRAAPNLVMQGVTTVVVNQDGRSPWPISEQRRLLEANGIGPNAMLLVGHGTVRRQVMGTDFQRPARSKEGQEQAQADRQCTQPRSESRQLSHRGAGLRGSRDRG